MIYRNLIGRLKWPFILIAVLILVYPLLALVLEAFPSESNMFSVLSSTRVRALFLRTLIWSGSVSLVTVIIAVFAASFFWMKNLENNFVLIVLLLIAFLVPPFIHSAAWSHVLIDVFNLSYRVVASNIVTAWIQICCYLSLAVGFVLLALSSVDKQEIAVGKTLANDFRVYKKIVLPSIKPVIVILVGIVFILSFSDYTVPSLFAQNVYSLEIMAEFSSSYAVSRAFLLAIPLLIVQLLVFSVILINLKKGIFQKDKRMDFRIDFDLPMLIKIVLFIASIVLIIVVTLPIISLLINKGSIVTFRQAINASTNELSSSFKINFLAALSMAIFALPLSLSLMASKFRKVFTILLVVPLVLPASLIGMSLIQGFYGFLPRSIYSSILLPILAVWQKSFPIVLLFTMSSLEFGASKYLEAGAILGKRSDVILKLLLPIQTPTILASFVVAFVMGFNEIGATLLVVPPGMTTLSIKIYNYLHYGATDFVNALCLTILSTAILAAIILSFLWKKRKVAL